ncbi:MAG: hypothetical protein K0Q74_1346, partial [Gammaproteobacteria bacterium]|nr:hypothetical protein [Gammaproteobacteria bacterium]
MSTNIIIATVTSVKGSAIVTDANGQTRIVKAGDHLYLGDTLHTLDGSFVVLTYSNGLSETILANATFEFNDLVFQFLTGLEPGSVDPMLVAGEVALLANADPSKVSAAVVEEEPRNEGDNNAFFRDPDLLIGDIYAGYPTIGIHFGERYIVQETQGYAKPEEILAVTLPPPIINDAPTITVALVGQMGVDETDGAVFSAAETDVVGGNLGTVFVPGSSLFTVTPNVGNGDPGTVTYAFRITNANSGLETSQGVPIVLVNNGGVIEGQAAGQVVFTLSINPANGDVTLTDNAGIFHPNPNDPNDPLSIPPGVLAVDITLTNNNGSATGSVDFGPSVTFLDDGPSISVLAEVGNTTLHESDQTSG